MIPSPRQLFRRALLGGAFLSLFTGCPEKSEPRASAPSSEQPAALSSPSSVASAPAPLTGAQKSAVPTSFEEVAAQLDAGGTFYAYLSTEQWLSGLSAQLAGLRDAMAPPPTASKEEQESFRKGFALALDALKKSGLEQLTGVGMSSFSPSATLVRNKVFLSHPRGQGNGLLWSLLGPPPHKLDALALLPAQTALASFGDLDPGALADFFRQLAESSGEPELKQTYDQAMASLSGMAGMPGDEALKALKGQAGLILTLDPAAPIQIPMGAPGAPVTAPRPALALLLPAHDDRIFQQLDKLMAANPGTTRTDSPGLQLRVMSELPILPELKLKPALARWGDFIIIASDEKLVHDIVEAKTSGKGYTAQAEFAALKAGLPTEGNGFNVVSRAFKETFSQLQGAMMKNTGAIPPQQLALMNQFSAQYARAAYSVTTHLENGWLFAGNATTVAGTNSAALPGAIMAAMAMPAMQKARGNAQATSSLSNLRQIGLSLQMYTSDNNGKFPATLEELVPKYLPDAKPLRSPFAPEDSKGYTYTAPAAAAEPAATAPAGSGLFGKTVKPKPAPAAEAPIPANPLEVVAEDAHSVEKGHVRILLHRDGSVVKEDAP